MKKGIPEMSDIDQSDLTALTVQLLSAYVANNSVASEDLAGLIQSTRIALSGVTVSEPEAPTFTPAVSIRKSVSSRTHIISLIDGKPYKTLKRHLGTHGLTPAEYRERYNLPKDYPLVAPDYSEQRRATAAKIGLGRKPTDATPRAKSKATASAKAVRKPATAKPAKAAPVATKTAADAITSPAAAPAAPKAVKAAKARVPAAAKSMARKAAAKSPRTKKAPAAKREPAASALLAADIQSG
jgi:predicted transcriptional regulator